ncbi:MAG: hypothetical protein JWM95_4674 [Gemmatimonadetes bacterium]|nr:hypothetical protein [Gemmatimonadota bacterium]
MFDDLNSETQGEGEKRERTGRSERPLADREVPLAPPSTTIAAAVHAWLDGETPERDARRGEWSRDVDFWKKMDSDLARRRRMRTPAHLQAQIMAAIPQHTPQVITPWWRREFVVTPSAAIVAVVTLMAASAFATAMILH